MTRRKRIAISVAAVTLVVLVLAGLFAWNYTFDNGWFGGCGLQEC